jgi:hypothetical protein
MESREQLLAQQAEVKSPKKKSGKGSDKNTPPEEDVSLPNINPDNLPAIVEETEKSLMVGLPLQENKTANTGDVVSATDKETELKNIFLDQLKKELIEDLKEFLRPEMINRYDDIIIFEPLTRDHIIQIVDVMIKETLNNLKDQEIVMTISPAAKAKLGEMGYDPVFGARPLKRVIQEMIDTPLSDLLIGKVFVGGDKILCDYKTNAFTFEKSQPDHSDTKKTKPEVIEKSPAPALDQKQGTEDKEDTGQRIEKLPV